MPTKTWAVGEEVLAEDFQAYLQNQVVTPFPTAADRNTAWPTPLAGQTAWLADLKVLTVYDGAAWQTVAPGLPRSHSASVTGDGTQRTSTAYGTLPVPLALTHQKRLADSWLEVILTGHFWIDDAVASAQVGLQTAGAAAVTIDDVSSFTTNTLATIATTTRTAYGTVGPVALNVQWKVGASGTVISMIGRWTMLSTERLP